jgi:hypothetical protein
MNLTSLPFTLLCNTFIIIFIKQTEIIKKTIKKFYIYKDKILTCNCQSLIKLKKPSLKKKAQLPQLKQNLK